MWCFGFSCSSESPYISPELGVLLPTRRTRRRTKKLTRTSAWIADVPQSALAFLRLASARSNLKKNREFFFPHSVFYSFCRLKSRAKDETAPPALKKTQNLVREVASNYRNTPDFKMQYLPIYKSDWGEIFFIVFLVEPSFFLNQQQSKNKRRVSLIMGIWVSISSFSIFLLC